MRRRIHLGIGAAVASVSIVAAATIHPSTPASPECGANAGITAASDSTDELRLLLNVPAYRLDVIEHQRVMRTISVAVGQPGYRTPLGHFQVDYVVWNPWWRPPASDWARKERPQPPGWSNPVGGVAGHVVATLLREGVDTNGLAMERIDELARLSRRRPARIAVDSLFSRRDSTP
jgi:hypothetical protein